MPNNPLHKPTPTQERYAAAVAEHGSAIKAAVALGVNRRTIDRCLAKRNRVSVPLPPARVRSKNVRRWLLTAAQDDTPVDGGFWRNWVAFSRSISAPIIVGGFTYQKGLFEDHASRTAVFSPVVQPFLSHENMMLGPLLFAAKMNILPTAVRPLSGLDTYSRGAWAVFPHAKTQLVSVPALPGSRPSQIMTTGACTIPNYIEKKAGLKAEFHHSIGGVIVEVDDEDRVFCRHIGAAADGSFQDLDVIVRNGVVSTGHRIEALVAGDLHVEKADPEVFQSMFGYDLAQQCVTSTSSLLHTLRPKHVAWHDILDFTARNHHRRTDHHHAVKMSVRNTDSIEAETLGVARFLRATAYDWMTSVVVASNHNDALQRWLREADPRVDPINARYWCELNAELYRNLEAGRSDFDVFRWAVSRHDAQSLSDIVFVPRNGSYLVCQDKGGIELGLHGDEGPNGARGSALALTRVATRMVVGHAHSPSILDGVMVVGLCGLMDQSYNSGPSSWQHAQGIVYANSKRTLVTLVDGKWRG